MTNDPAPETNEVLRWEVRADEDGDLHTYCPRCEGWGTIVEQDAAIRWNTLEFRDDPTVAVAHCGSSGDYDFEQWYCTECGASDLAEPEGFEIQDWL